MKIALTGATGFVGAEVLSQLLAHPTVTQVTCVTRRALPVTDSKLVPVLHDDFAHYSDPLLETLSDHSGAIWTLGGKASDFRTVDEYERVTHTFTTSFARAVASRVSGRFSFCYLSGMGADPSESSWLPWEKTTRHVKGRTEKDLLALRREHEALSVYCFRPGGILPRGSRRWVHRLLAPWVIGVEELAKSLVFAATMADLRAGPTFENREIERLVARPVTR